MSWREDFIPVNRWTRPGTKLPLVRKIVLHYTANPGASAANHVTYFGKTLPGANNAAFLQYGEVQARARNLIREASAHFFVDAKEAILVIPLSEIAYHASQANPYSIGIEMCIEEDGSFAAETVWRTAEIVKELCALYQLNPGQDVIRHYDVTGKICPKPYVDHPSAWEAFKKSLQEEREDMNNVLKFEEWAWNELNTWLGDAYNEGIIEDWKWVQAARDRMLTYTDLLLLKVLIDERRRNKA